MLAVAARVGAPLGHDFCAISLSDNLKSWAVIERRVQAAASAGFVIAFYNPISRTRPWRLGRAFELLRGCLPPGTPVIFGRAIGRDDEQIRISSLATANATTADMSTCVNHQDLPRRASSSALTGSRSSIPRAPREWRAHD